MSEKDDAWRKFLGHERIVAGLLELAVGQGSGKFRRLSLTRTDTRELRFVADGRRARRR